MKKDKRYKVSNCEGRTKAQFPFYRKLIWSNLRNLHPVLYETIQWMVMLMALAALLRNC